MEDTPTFLLETNSNTQEGSLPFRSDVPESHNKSPMPQSQTSLPQFKLRSSCDACGLAKIKCDRGQPVCGRCTAQGTNCVYGVSRKGGKPPRRQPAAVSSCPVEPEVTSINLTSTGHNSHNSLNLDLGGQNGITSTMMPSLDEDSMAIDSIFSASNNNTFQTWFPFDSSGSPGPSTSSYGDRCLSEQISSSATASTRATSEAGRPYCTQESKDIMRQLYCANPSAPISDGVPAQVLDLDSVLMRNRDIVARLMTLFKCPCARLPHTAMLYSSIVSRVLLWYHQATCNLSSLGTSPLSVSSFPPTSVGQETLPLPASSVPLTLMGQEPFQAMPKRTMTEGFGTATSGGSNVSVVPTPVMLGSFRSNDGNVQTALTNYLILTELWRVGSLIDAFISLGTSPPELLMASDACPAALEVSSNVADASLFGSLGTWLQTEYRRIVRKTRSGLSLLDESLGF